MRAPWRAHLLGAIACLLCGTSAWAQQISEEEELALAYGDKSTISIATGSKVATSRAPAVASIVTAQEIAAMGATDLDQVLESLPGIHVSRLSFSSSPIYSFRGIYSQYNPQVLMLLNGQPMTRVFLGNRGLAWGGFPLEHVARIEVLRGPGSALYGADAYSGVINIITKSAEDMPQGELRLRAGHFATRDASWQQAFDMAGMKTALFLRAGSTDGQHSTIEKDFQTTLDGVFGTHASLAPGPVSAERKAFDAHADVAINENWRFRATWQWRKFGMLAGLADAVDPYSRMAETRGYLDLGFNDVHFAPNWELSANLYYNQSHLPPGDPAYMLFPPGAFGGAFPDGAFGNPGHSERHTALSLSAAWLGVEKHRMRVGAGARLDDMYAAPEVKNFTFVVVPGVGPVFSPLGGMVDATGNPALVYMLPHKRHVSYVYGQDEWSLAKDWTLTAGLRYDRYSDFGSTTNPRVALVWDAAYDVVVKALHGRAFRAPSYTELYSINNPVSRGNPALRAETVNTDELVFSWQPATALQAALTLFHYQMDDVIRFTPNADPTTGQTANNVGSQVGDGFELEANWDVSRQLRVSGNYSLQHATDKVSGLDAGLSPHQKLFVRTDWRPAQGWRIGAAANYVAGRVRQAGDARPPIADYTTVDLTVARETAAGWEWRVSATNLFNCDVREPTLAPGNEPYDLPSPGRAISLQLLIRL